ncbi:hypothetical protein [Streptomyces sp. V3I7]|uniref:hypothetical protein n=1 Tax=Streptomyces sp. V3I7 TaxID=3042278 RepID=UPI00278B4092|nr:hypothetical protein [Streptomyces sp. V3I7]MDQ0992173.1 membrane protein DedA with SNARE-associated domain [Streptomyces sp. V3I7]
MREHVTTALDAGGLLLIAAGAGAGAYQLIGWAALAVSGAVVLSGSWLAAAGGRKGGRT